MKRIMKLTFLFVCAFVLSLSAGVRAQDQMVTLKVEGSTFKEVISELKRYTRLDFFYSFNEVDVTRPISLNVTQERVDDVLRLILGDGFTWEYHDDMVIIKPALVKDEEVKPLKVKGFVYDENKVPMPGVTVVLMETTVGAVTDAMGWFQLTLPINDGQLEFSFVGYRSQKVSFSRATENDTLKIYLKPDVKAIDEVVVTGYGNVAKGNYTGASTTVNAKDILMPGVSSIDQMLQGVVPGMLVMNRTGMVGASPSIRVRGTSTLLGRQEPVWVVDGVIQRNPQPFNSDDNTNFTMEADDIKKLAGNAISWLNPNDIETITVLKDASATAIYGSQAANGVIVITTKKASTGRVQVSYSGDFSIGQRPRYGLYDLMNSAERMEFSKDIYDEDRSFSGSQILLNIGFEGLLSRYLNKEITLDEMNTEYQRMAQQNTDWFDILFRNSFNHSHNLSFSGGSETVQNRTSFGYSQENGEARGNNVTQFTVNSNTTINLWECVTLNLSLNGSIRDVKGFAYGVDPFSYAYNTSRVIPAFNEDGTLYYHDKTGTESSAIQNKSTYRYNILNEMANTGSRNKTRTWGASFDLKWQIISGLEYQGLFSYTSSSSDTKSYATDRSFHITQIRGYEYGSVESNGPETQATPLPIGGLLETDLSNVTTIMVRNSLVYDRLFKDKHRMTLQLGVETNSVDTKGETNTRYGYMPDRGETFATPPLTYVPVGGDYTMENSAYAQGNHTVVNRVENTFSGYGMAVYSYDERYVLNLNGRVDASNRFGQDKNKQFQPTWSAGLKWRAGNENFARETWWLNNLDIYISYGYQGNAVSTVSPYLIARDEYQSLYNTYALRIQSLAYPDLGWEKTKSFNVGVDAAFLDGRLNFTFNYFRKVSDVYTTRNIPYENGMGSGVVSGSKMNNNGYDFVINVAPVRTKDFAWQLSLNTSVTKNSVENNRDNTLEDYLSGSAVVDGRPYSTFYSYEFAGLEQEYGQPTFNKLDQTVVDSPLDFLVESGKLTPDFSGGLNMSFRYKNLTLYTLFAVQWGGYGRLPNLYPTMSLDSGLPLPQDNVSKKLINRWRKPGDDTIYPSLPGTGFEPITLPTIAQETNATATGLRYSSYALYNQSNIRVAKTDFIRCRSISLGYDFRGDWMQRAGVNYLRVSASMTNPFVWAMDKKWDGLDPETGNWPARRISSLSLQVIF